MNYNSSNPYGGACANRNVIPMAINNNNNTTNQLPSLNNQFNNQPYILNNQQPQQFPYPSQWGGGQLPQQPYQIQSAGTNVNNNANILSNGAHQMNIQAPNAVQSPHISSNTAAVAATAVIAAPATGQVMLFSPQQAVYPISLYDFTFLARHTEQVMQLRNRFLLTVNKKGKTTQVFVELEILGLRIPIRIDFSIDFPQVKPSVFLRKFMIQQHVSEQTLKLVYDSFFRWDPTTSSLLKLVTSINETFIQYPPQPDYLSQQINEMKEMIKEADEKKKIAAFDASKVFPGFSESEFTEVMQHKGSLRENIENTAEIKNIRQRIGQVAEFNLKMSTDLLEQRQNLETKKYALTELSLNYETLKQELNQIIQASSAIKDRFSNMSVMQALGLQIDSIEEEAVNLSGNFDTDVQNYREKRQKYHLLVQKRERLMKSS